MWGLIHVRTGSHALFEIVQTQLSLRMGRSGNLNSCKINKTECTRKEQTAYTPPAEDREHAPHCKEHRACSPLQGAEGTLLLQGAEGIMSLQGTEGILPPAGELRNTPPAGSSRHAPLAGSRRHTVPGRNRRHILRLQ